MISSFSRYLIGERPENSPIAHTAKKMLPERSCILCVLSLIALLPAGTHGFSFSLFQTKNSSQVNATTASSVGSTTKGVQASMSTGRLPAVTSTSPSPVLTTKVPPSVSTPPEVPSYPAVSPLGEFGKVQIVHVPYKKTLENGFVTQIDVENEAPQVFQSNDYMGSSDMGLEPSTFVATPQNTVGTPENTVVYPQNSWSNYPLYSYQPTPWDIRSIYEYPMYSAQPVPWVTPRMYDVAPLHPWLYNAYNAYSPPVSWNRYRRQSLPEYYGRYAPFFPRYYYPQSYQSPYTHPFTNTAPKTYKNEFAGFEYIPYTHVEKRSENTRTADVKSTGKTKPHKEHPHTEGKSHKEKQGENEKPKNKIHFLVPPESEIKKEVSERGNGAENSMTGYQAQYPFYNHHPIRHGHHNPYYQHQYYSTY